MYRLSALIIGSLECVQLKRMCGMSDELKTDKIQYLNCLVKCINSQ